MTIIGSPTPPPGRGGKRYLHGKLDPNAPLRPRPRSSGFRSQTMVIACPKCKVLTNPPRGVGMAFCKASSPPFFGHGRGCGWLLVYRPPYQGGDRGYCDALIDCKRFYKEDRGDFIFRRDQLKDLVARVYERWERWGYGKVVKEEDGSLRFQEHTAAQLASLAVGKDETPN